MAESGSATRRFGCPSCGGGLRYEIASGRMKCDRCGSETELSRLPEEQEEDMMDVTEYHCPQCGAAVYSTDQEITSFCTFCGSDVVLTGKMGRAKRPGRIVPFRVTRESCETAYRNHLKKYLLAPADLKKAETVSHFRPVYVPFWSYSVRAEGPMKLEGKRSYTRGNKRYDETYDLSMDAKIHQDDILYDASTVFEDETAAQLRHTAKKAKPFHPAYLSGFFAQGADVPAETYEKEAAASAVKLFVEQIKKETGMDSVTVNGGAAHDYGLPDPRYREELVMMPVWLLAHRQGQRVVYTAVNGQNGEVVCDVPVSNGKVMGVMAAAAAVLFLLLHMFLTIKPEPLMALCAVIALVTQYQFSGFQKRLFLRQTRAFEPDFAEGGRAYAGPAQQMLKKNSVSLKGKAASVFPVIFVALMVITTIFIRSGSNLISLTRGAALTASSMRGIWPMLVVAAVCVVMIVHTVRRLKNAENGPSWPRLVSCAACAAGLIAMLTGQAEDLIFYACAAAILISAMIELIIVNRAHNEYASRPVPFFGGEEEENA